MIIYTTLQAFSWRLSCQNRLPSKSKLVSNSRMSILTNNYRTLQQLREGVIKTDVSLLVTKGLKRINVVVFGDPLAGKSSLLNALYSSLVNGHKDYFEVGSGNEIKTKLLFQSVLSTFKLDRNVPLRIGQEDRSLKLCLWDAAGWSPNHKYGPHLHILTSLLDGHIKDGFDFTASAPLKKSPHYRETPQIGKDNVQLVFVVIEACHHNNVDLLAKYKAAIDTIKEGKMILLVYDLPTNL